MCDKAPSISPRQRICDSCRKELAKIPLPDPMPHPTPDSTPCDSVSESDSETECTGTISPPSTEALQVESSESLALVNQCLDTIGDTPLTKRSYSSKNTQGRQLRRLHQ